MIFYEWKSTGSAWSKKKEWNLHIIYNKQIPLCSKTILNNCRSVHDLCSADNNYNFDFNLEGDVKINYNNNNDIILLYLFNNIY